MNPAHTTGASVTEPECGTAGARSRYRPELVPALPAHSPLLLPHAYPQPEEHSLVAA